MIYEKYNTRHILNVHKHVDGGWFWNKYSASPYLGCEWGCQYCYLRDEKYNPHKATSDNRLLDFDDPFSEYIKIKEEAPQLLRKALEDKPRDLIYLDGYQPVDRRFKYNREILKICLDLGFPVFINEKSPLLLRDLDILREINEKSYLNVGWSIITTHDDGTRSIFEPKAPPVRDRFKAMKTLADNRIPTGTVMMPLLPHIYDNEENIADIVKETKDHGGEYVLDGGLTLNGYCKNYFYNHLQEFNSSLVEKYEELYTDEGKLADNRAKTHEIVLKQCEQHGIQNHIQRPVDHYTEPLRINKKIAGKFYLKARKINLIKEKSYREWAYRKAAWALDDLNRNVGQIYKEEGIDGLTRIKGIGKSLSKQILNYLV
jgi:DNA repair photolyase